MENRLASNVPLGPVPTALLVLTFNEACHFQDYSLVWLIHFLQRSQCNLQRLLSSLCHFYKDPGGNIVSPPLWILCCIVSWSLHTCWRLWCLFPQKADCSYKSWWGEEKQTHLYSSKSWQTKIIKSRNSSHLKTHIEWELVDKIILGDQGINLFLLIKNTSVPYI